MWTTYCASGAGHCDGTPSDATKEVWDHDLPGMRGAAVNPGTWDREAVWNAHGTVAYTGTAVIRTPVHTCPHKLKRPEYSCSAPTPRARQCALLIVTNVADPLPQVAQWWVCHCSAWQWHMRWR